MPKYRYRVLQGKIKEEVELCVRDQVRQMGSEVVEMNVQADHVHVVVQVPPKLSISDYMGQLKDKSAIRVFSVFRDLRRHRYWENHFWAQGYCVGTVVLDEDMIRKYVVSGRKLLMLETARSVEGLGRPVNGWFCVG